MKTNLSKKAMLVQLEVSFWTGRKKDKIVSDEVQTVKEATNDTGNWYTRLVSKSDIHELRVAMGNCRVMNDNLTLPWSDNGMRILPAAMVMTYREKMKVMTEKYDKAIEKFCNETYPKILATAEKRLGKLKDTLNFPSAAEIKNKFGYKIRFYPIPDATDFRIDLTQDELSEMQKEITANVSGLAARAEKDLWNQLNDLIGKVSETLKDKEKTFKNSLVDNLKEFLETLPKMNFTDNPELENIRKEALDKLTKLHPDTLRTIPVQRQKVQSDAEALIEKMKSYIA